MREKIKKWEELKEVVEKSKGVGESIVFTNGCFDLIHVGHTRYLEEAKKQGDIFIVAVNSDSSVRTLKGENRPIIPEEQRAEVVAALGCVDYVTVFSELDPLRLITYLKPDYLVKGGDWAEDSIIGKDVVEGEGEAPRAGVVELPLNGEVGDRRAAVLVGQPVAIVVDRVADLRCSEVDRGVVVIAVTCRLRLPITVIVPRSSPFVNDSIAVIVFPIGDFGSSWVN